MGGKLKHLDGLNINEKISQPDTRNILENFIKDVSLNIMIFKIDTLNYLNMIYFIIKARIN